MSIIPFTRRTLAILIGINAACIGINIVLIAINLWLDT